MLGMRSHKISYIMCLFSSGQLKGILPCSLSFPSKIMIDLRFISRIYILPVSSFRRGV